MQLSDETITRIIESYSPEWRWCREYGERGYDFRQAETPRVVLGSYWLPKGHKRYDVNEPRMQDYSNLHPRLWAQMASQGVEFEWHDEWEIDDEHGKAYRNTADSYSWIQSFTYDDYGNMLTPDSPFDEWLGYALNDETKFLANERCPGLEPQLKAAGFEQFNGRFENGWHPGQDDTPHEVVERIHRELGPEVDIVFTIPYVGQFDTAFHAWARLDQTPRNEP